MRMILKKYMSAALAFLALGSCEKNTFGVTERNTPGNVAFVKVAYLSPFNISSNTQVYFNGERFTNNLVYATSFPGSGMNMTGSAATSDYLALTPGPHKVEFIIPVAGTVNPLTKIFETTQNFNGNEKQTLYVTDTAAATVAFTLSDEAATPDSGKYKLRFINAVPNLLSADLYKGANSAAAVLIQADVKYATGTPYFELPSGTDSFFVRPTGAPITTVPIVRRGFALGSQRVFSMVARGYNGQTSVSRGINLSVIINQ